MLFHSLCFQVCKYGHSLINKYNFEKGCRSSDEVRQVGATFKLMVFL